MAEIAVTCKHCQKPMSVPKTFVGKFAEFRCTSCGKSFGVVPSDSQERKLNRGAEEVMNCIQQKMIDIAQEHVMGWPIAFRVVKDVKWAVMRRVEVITPSGHVIDVGAVTFSDDGKVCNYPKTDTPTLTAILDHLDPKDRF